MAGSKSRNRLKQSLRQKTAVERHLARDGRSDQQQYERLVKAGHGHCKEAKRLKEKISA